MCLELGRKWRWEVRLEDKVGPVVKGLDLRSKELGLHPVNGREITEEAPKDSTSKQSTGI